MYGVYYKFVDTKVPKCVGHLNDMKFIPIPVKTFVIFCT